ncbi:MAG: hypothetical protein EPN64_13225 [Burkholderiaceae bacterium]|nr:MAG: hypothetical protein EPN64_13225 [Burkholderiaceae bacterium]
MVKAAAKKSDEQITDQTATDEVHQDVRSEVGRVLDEIEEAAGVAEQSLAKDAAANTPVTTPEPSAESADPSGPGDNTLSAAAAPEKSHEELEREKAAEREARISFLVKRAKLQKARGRAQLERVVVGAMAIRKEVEFYDVNIASSAERFLGLIDLAIYTINRRGEYVLGESDAAAAMDRFAALVADYKDKGVSERDQSDLLLKNEQELAFDTDWIVPEYRDTAFKMEVFIKHPSTLKVLDGLFAFDKLVRNLTVLQWNGKVDQARVDQARQQERRALSQIHQFAGRSLIGLNRRAKPTRRSAAPTQQEEVAEHQNEGSAVVA